MRKRRPFTSTRYIEPVVVRVAPRKWIFMAARCSPGVFRASDEPLSVEVTPPTWAEQKGTGWGERPREPWAD
jgi:hypothetical protein